MRDRAPTNPNRRLITPENGSPAFFATVDWADGAIEPGSLYSKGNVLPDDVANRMRLVDPEPRDVFSLLTGYIEYTVNQRGYNAMETLTALSVARLEVKAATDGEGSVLIGGGRVSNTAQNIVEKYSPAGVRTIITSLLTARRDHAAANDGDGNVLFGAGNSAASAGESVILNSVERYTPAGARSSLSNLSVARQALAAATDGEGNALFGGGQISGGMSAALDKYSPAGVRATLSNLSVARYRLAAATDGNGNVNFAGGQDSSSFSTVVDRVSPTGVLSTLPALTARGQLAGTHDGGGNVLFGGGYNGNMLSTVEKYTPGGIKTVLDNLSVQRYLLAATTDGAGNANFAGGQPNTTGFSAVIDRYSPAGVHTVIASLTQARHSLAAATDGNGNPVFAGGQSATNAASAVVNRLTANLSITSPYYPAKYRFNEHTAEQDVPANGVFTVNAGTPNSGYVRIHAQITV